MTPRVFANVVYAWLMGRAVDPEDREKLDAALYAPLEGEQGSQGVFLANLTAAAGDG